MSNIAVYPNPASAELIFKAPFHPVSVQVCNMMGQKMPVAVMGDRIDIAALPEGHLCAGLAVT